ncbi:enoyl-CoA hydratase/isomerase family protein [Alkalihalobacterium elongatum]|uniref:enoyl-CoA hydratase/isomerase family protein n=1 Tax=Alkalihalobacterium elongatum TaxID=2675466 RepID=UPI001C201046|nr:enoyl-CoA hydratase/isomerase family protein [Alkalihalobacterium elongatum]
MLEKVQLIREDGIAWLIINREDKRNAVDYDVMNLLTEKLDEIEQNEEDKLVVIRGKGDQAFCSGGDLSIFHLLHTKKEAEQMLSKMGEILFRLFFFPKPTVAAINGTAVGGGCELATACDFRIAAPHAKVGFVQGTLGITTGWGASTMLFERIDQANALQMLMTAKRFGVEEAVKLNFIQQIIDAENFEAGCKEWVTPFLKQSTPVLRAYKKRFNDQFDKASVKHRFLNEIEECSTLWESDEHHAAVERFLSK